MAITVPTTTSDYTTVHNGTATSVTVNKPTNVADGDTLVVWAYFRNNSGTITPPSGWTAVSGSLQTTQATIQAFTKPIPSAAGETATSYTFSYSGTTARCNLTCFRATGVDSTTPIDASGTWVTTGTTSIVLPAVTAVSSTAMLIGFALAQMGSTTVPTLTPPGGMTLLIEDDFNNGTNDSSTGVFFKSLSSSGSTGTQTITVSASPSSVAGFMFTLNPAVTIVNATVVFPVRTDVLITG